MTKQIVVVAGGGGFIGGHLIKKLLQLGTCHVRAVDIKPLADWYQAFPAAENFAGPVSGDARDFRVCRKVSRGASDVYQLAADMGGMGFIENNKALCMLSVLTNTHMLLASQEAGVKRFFFSSSACVYNAEKQVDPNVTALAEADAYPRECAGISEKISESKRGSHAFTTSMARRARGVADAKRLRPPCAGR